MITSPKSYCATHFQGSMNITTFHVKLINLYLHLMHFYLHSIVIKVSSWLHMLLEWFWSSVKMCAFQWPYNGLTNGTFQFEIWKTVIRDRSENFHFQGSGVGLLEGGQKISFSRGRGLPLWVGFNFLGGSWYPFAYYEARRGNPVIGEGLFRWSREHIVI